MKTFLTIILAITFCFAEDPVKPLPKDVQTIVDSREKALQEARIAFDKAVFKANDDAVKKMETVVKINTQKGDLDGALASKKFVEDWNKEKDAVAVSGALGGAGPKENDLAKKIVGKWNVRKNDGSYVAVWTINTDGSIDSNNGITSGKWVINGEIIRITWSDVAWEEINLPITKNTSTINSWNGGSKCGIIKR